MAILTEAESDDGEIYGKTDNEDALRSWAEVGGWDTLEHFYEDTGVTWDEIKGKWWTIVHGRLFMADDGWQPKPEQML